MKLRLTRLIPSTALVCLLLASCNKEDAVKTPSTMSPENARVTSMIGAVQDASDQEFSDIIEAESPGNLTGKGADVADDCPVKTFNPSKDVYPHTVTLDYGSGCVDAKGATRSGQVSVKVFADYRTAPSGTLISVTTYNNYYVNGINISGNVVNKLVAAASPGPLVLRSVFHRTVSDGSGNTSTYIGSATRTLIAGDPNGPKEDKTFSIDEHSYGVELSPDAPPNAWKLGTRPNSPKIKSGDCLFATQGVVHINLVDRTGPTREVLDYGDGTCDNMATLRIDGGAEQPITLPFIFFTQHL